MEGARGGKFRSPASLGDRPFSLCPPSSDSLLSPSRTPRVFPPHLRGTSQVMTHPNGCRGPLDVHYRGVPRENDACARVPFFPGISRECRRVYAPRKRVHGGLLESTLHAIIERFHPYIRDSGNPLSLLRRLLPISLSFRAFWAKKVLRNFRFSLRRENEGLETLKTWNNFIIDKCFSYLLFFII